MGWHASELTTPQVRMQLTGVWEAGLPAPARARPAPSWRVTLIVAWCSMRGAVALAAALAVPITTAGGGPFPARDEIVFLTYAVILVGQGLTLGPLIRLLGVPPDDRDAREEVLARLRAAVLRNRGEITDEVMRRVQRDLDLEEARLDR